MLRINEFKIENLSSDCFTDNPAPVFSFSMISSEKNVLLKKAILSVNNWMEVFERQTGLVYEGPELTPFTKYLAILEITDDHGKLRKLPWNLKPVLWKVSGRLPG